MQNYLAVNVYTCLICQGYHSVSGEEADEATTREIQDRRKRGQAGNKQHRHHTHPVQPGFDPDGFE